MMNSSILLRSGIRGALFGALLLSIEEVTNFLVDQPALALSELGSLLAWYAGAMAILGLSLFRLQTPLAHILGLLAATGGFMAGGKIAEELWWKDFSQTGANAVGYPLGFLLASAGLWLTLRFTRNHPSIRTALTWSGLIFVPAFRAMNINAYGSPLHPDALMADAVLLAVCGVVALVSWRWHARMSSTSAVAAVALLVGGGTVSLQMASAPVLPPPATEKSAPDVLLVVIDTLRADHLGVYGHSVDTTPNLDSFAEQGLRYTQTGSPASWTLPSFGAYVTGRYPSGHGAGINTGEKNTQSGLDPDVPTLAEQLKSKGYRTGAIVTNPYLKDSFGLSRGFDTYSDALGLAHTPMFIQPLRMLKIPVMGGRYFYRPADMMVDEALAWWDQMEGGSRFLMLHLMDPHDPYNPPQTSVDAIGTPHKMDVLNQYDQEIHFTDRELGRLLSHVDENTIVFVTSDHGETFGEHEDPYPNDHWPFTRHGHTLYQELLHVPLLVRGPGIEPGVVDRPVRSFDVVPTILALTESEPMETHGDPLWEVLGGRAEGADRGVGAQAMRFGTEKRSVRLENMKLIETRWGNELYDLSTDTLETDNLAQSHPQEVERLLTYLPPTREGGQVNEIDEETQRQLESLGYMQ